MQRHNSQGFLFGRAWLHLLQPWSLLAALLLGLTACAPAPQPPLRVGTNIWSGYEPLYLARSLGHYANAEKLPEIRLIELQNATNVMRALRNRELEAAALTLDETLSLLAEGMKLRVVLIFDYSNGGDALLARPGIDQLAELRGKRLGVENSALGAVMLDSALTKAGLGVEDVRVETMTVDTHVRAYQDGKVDAVITFEPGLSRLRVEGAKVLFDSREIPGRIIDVLAVREDALKTHEAGIKRLLAGHFAALKYLQDQPADAYAHMRPRLGEDVAGQLSGLYLPMLEDNHTGLARLNGRAQALADFMVTRNLLPGMVQTHGLADDRFLPPRPTP